MFKVQVETAKNYIFTTSSNGSSYDTYLSLYDHNFNEIAYNDDYSGVYPRIDKYLAKGDYYIVVRGYNWNPMNSYR